MKDEPEYIKRDSSGSCLSICRDGIEEHWNKLVNEDGLSYRKAAQVILESIEHVAGEPDAPDLPTETAIIDIGRNKKPTVGSSHSANPVDMTDEELQAEHEANDQQFDRFRERYNDVAREYCRRENERTREEAANKYKGYIPNWDELSPEQRYDVARDLWTWRHKIEGYLEMTEEERVASKEKWQRERKKADQEAKERAEEAWRAWAAGLGIKEDEVEPSPAMVDFISKAFELVPADQKKAVAKDVYYAVSKRLHPDVGGATEDMQKLTALYEELNDKL